MREVTLDLGHLPLLVFKEILMRSDEVADQFIYEVQEEFPFLQGHSILVMALVRASGEVIKLRERLQAAERPVERGDLRGGDHPAGLRLATASVDEDQALADVADDGDSVPEFDGVLDPGSFKCPNCDGFDTDYDRKTRYFFCNNCEYEEVR